ncbi:unnamed protein product [Vitrella brassicaformis CCMP3155]|uniref:Eukaryotic translation initiation factor 3 subunit G n=2 Tax=Vitrella brassicaformis TaxID=1169539 RepID=A0A0G4EIE2_VITBC|nr:unnamed protein product [Vitrella brassicaformis CCMP3155]|mmetsp:Transcript_35583/g.88487  ORF Transcript_35583/g.88487 Transcript_35583/m.88487 type:complete len:291 (+) Transcript_35583:74-946(+)|eukprot:CEL95773.1 unnamed protein product [Vitrella brassicaformis CCMP3155]
MAAAVERRAWADEADDEPILLRGGDHRNERFESAPDENGIRTVTYYEVNDRGQTLKITKRIRSGVRRYRLNKNVEARKDLVRFGALAGGEDDSTTVPHHEDLQIEMPQNNAYMAIMQEKEGDDDWYAFDLQPKQNIWAKYRKKEDEEEKKDEVVDKVDVKDPTGPQQAARDPSKPGKYVPPSQRAGARQLEQQQKEECTVRVTNLSEDVREADLGELFGSIGKVSRIFLAKQKDSRQSKGFAFVTYARRDDAAAAIKRLNGHGYDHLILNVEWAKPSNRENQPNQPMKRG